MLFRVLILMSFLAFAETFAQVPSINDLMTIEDQKKTGVILLKQSQKMALSEWLVDHGVKPSQKQIKVEDTKPLSISINIESGKKLLMNDGSLWEVAPDDIDTASGWLTSSQLEVSPSHQTDYPYVLKDKISGQSVLAKKIA